MTSRVPPEDVLLAVLDLSDDAIALCDTSCRITSWNASAVRLFGYAADEVMGQPVGSLFRPHHGDDVRHICERVMAGDDVRHFDLEAERADGLPMPASVSMCPILDPDKHPVAAVVLVRDVTEQVLAQAALSEVEAHVQAGEALAHVGSWLWDVGTGTVQWSAEFHRIVGVDPLSFEGTLESHLAVISGDDRDRVRAGMEAAVANLASFEDEFRVVLPAGGTRLVRARAEPIIGSGGAAVGLRGVGQHVTVRPPEDVPSTAD